MIKYSIIVPHYNIPNLLVRCLNSIPDRNDIQVIVVDDNSADENAFWKAILEVGHHNVEAYVTKEGRGAGYARNVALKYAQGVWLLFADADDFFTENFLDVINRYYEANADIIFFNAKSCLSEDVSIASDKTKDFMFESYRNNNDEKLFRFGYTEPWSKMIRRLLVIENGIKFDETKVANDYLFSVMTGYFAKCIQVVDVPIYVYTVRQGSLASDDNEVHLDKLLARLDAFMNVQAFMQSVGYRSTPALTSHILVPLFKNYNGVYRKYILMLKQNKLSVVSLIRDTFSHYLFKVIGKKDLYGNVYSIKWRK